jgi:hypothetical protein
MVPATFVPQDAGQLQTGPAAVGPVAAIDWVDASRPHRNADLTGAGLGIGELGQPELLRLAECRDDRCLHTHPSARQPGEPLRRTRMAG